MALCVRYAQPFSIAYASIQPHRLSHNNIMLNSQYHSHFDKMEAVFSPTAQPPQCHTPQPPFSAVQKKIKHCLLMAMCNKRFIHYSYITFQGFASLHHLSLHFASIHFTIYFAPHSKSIPSFHMAKPTHCFPCLGFCFTNAALFFVLI